jgi:hypothetical protein
MRPGRSAARGSLLTGLFFEVTTLDPVTFISVATLLLAVGAILRSSRRDADTDRSDHRAAIRVALARLLAGIRALHTRTGVGIDISG